MGSGEKTALEVSCSSLEGGTLSRPLYFDDNIVAADDGVIGRLKGSLP